MREKGELDTHVYAKMKHEEEVYGTIKRPDVIPKPFPSNAEEMKYPEPVLNKDNPLYRTSNNSYGSKLPSS